MAQPKIVIVKQFQWKGTVEEWSNGYFLKGATPTSNADWKILQDAIVDSERTVYSNNHSVVTVYGYEDGDKPSTYQYDYPALGQTPPGGTNSGGSNAVQVQGDSAAWVRCLVGQSSKGKNVYVRKYFHGIFAGSDPDAVHATTVTKMGAHANVMVGGGLPGGVKWCSPGGRDAIAPYVGRYLTTRTLKRRGKRP